MAPMRLSGIRLAACAALAAAGLAACASGGSRVDSLLHQVHPLDAAALGVAGAMILRASEADYGWSTRVADSGAGRYRISVVRLAGLGIGEGEFNMRFASEARRVASDRACNRYRVVAYEERLESRWLGSSRVAEGEIECL